MTIYIEGNGNNIDLTFAGSVKNDWFLFGNGVNDSVESITNTTTTSVAPTDISNDVIAFHIRKWRR
jgi:hypothetical protein